MEVFLDWTAGSWLPLALDLTVEWAVVEDVPAQGTGPSPAHLSGREPGTSSAVRLGVGLGIGLGVPVLLCMAAAAVLLTRRKTALFQPQLGIEVGKEEASGQGLGILIGPADDGTTDGVAGPGECSNASAASSSAPSTRATIECSGAVGGPGIILDPSAGRTSSGAQPYNAQFSLLTSSQATRCSSNMTPGTDSAGTGTHPLGAVTSTFPPVDVESLHMALQQDPVAPAAAGWGRTARAVSSLPTSNLSTLCLVEADLPAVLRLLDAPVGGSCSLMLCCWELCLCAVCALHRHFQKYG